MEPIDVAVIGAGPAGMTAALYAARAGYSVGLFERMMPGGQMGETGEIDNYPGFPDGVAGFDLSMQMMQQCTRFGVQQISAEVTGIDVSGASKVVSVADAIYSAQVIIIATGARSRKIEVPSEAEFAGRGVSYCATCDGNFFKGKPVVVVGGGNTAVADVAYLARICPKVYLVHRRDTLRATAAGKHAIDRADNVEYVWNSVVDHIDGEQTVSEVTVHDVGTDETRVIQTAAVFVAAGKIPNTEAFVDVVACDDAGYIVADEDGATSVPGVFVAGDCRTKGLRQVATAVSDGANAAETAATWLAS